MADAPLQIVVLLFPNVTQLDFTGPAQVFSKFPNTEVHLAWHTLDPVPTDAGWCIVPTVTLDDCPRADVLFVPGGNGAFDVFDDLVVLDFLRRQAEGARWVTSVCTGSFTLAAAGLLTGYRATSHWASLQMLDTFGALPVSNRVVRDRNRITGAGVTSGIDFAFVLAAELFGDEIARSIQLAIEYDPAPPFDNGSPEKADQAVVNKIIAATHGLRFQRVQKAARALETAGD
ncbi:AraC family transcriptional regulator [Arthrobacter livingstonensis]|uniref:AraC family transcriptional regulator n=1 Tax=Arthrobacter livingstonensis TaxID=670078 RepID=A0A2V5L5C2_9MICC|nr:DJ-1/PfpI family protein [Arthrobacter livingstonensis]PYI66701.1 AraC family transcriptional regulator [Arthrobacter livingstonensis]